MLGEIDRLAQAVLDQVRAWVARRDGSSQAIEQTVLKGLAASTEAVQELSLQLESGRLRREEAAALAEALSQGDQKLAVFQGCTMRRSTGQAGAVGGDGGPHGGGGGE